MAEERLTLVFKARCENVIFRFREFLGLCEGSTLMFDCLGNLLFGSHIWRGVWADRPYLIIFGHFSLIQRMLNSFTSLLMGTLGITSRICLFHSGHSNLKLNLWVTYLACRLSNWLSKCTSHRINYDIKGSPQRHRKYRDRLDIAICHHLGCLQKDMSTSHSWWCQNNSLWPYCPRVPFLSFHCGWWNFRFELLRAFLFPQLPRNRYLKE